MYLAELAEVAIGLVVVYFLVSMASSQILEWISQFLGWRAQDLETAIRGMILNQPVESRMFSGLVTFVKRLREQEPADTSPAANIIAQLYDHPLIKPLGSGIDWLGREIKPANIPTRAFALALFDTVISAGTQASTIQQALYTVRGRLDDPQGLEKDVNDALGQLIERAKAAAQANDAQALDDLNTELTKFTTSHPQFKPALDALLQVDPVVASAAFGQFTQALTGVAVNNPELKRTLGSLISQAALEVKEGENKVAAVRANVEAWFNGTMDQLSELYKRRSKLWAGAIALVLAVILNVDTLVIANTLWREPSLRQMVVAYAEKLQPPPATTLTATSAISPTQAMTPTQYISPTVTIMDLEQRLQGLQLPISGWELEGINSETCAKSCDKQECVKACTGEGKAQECVKACTDEEKKCVDDCNGRARQCFVTPGAKEVLTVKWGDTCYVLSLKDWQPGWRGILAKLAGWLITALAAAQGAPFWFDLLNKLLQLRGGEKKPEEKAATA